MKQHIQRVFEYMGRPENFLQSILLIMFYTLFCLILGMVIAWICYFLVNKDLDKRAYSFDDFIEDCNDHSSFKIRKVK